MFFGKGFRIGRVSSITISIDYSWFLIFALFVFLLATTWYPHEAHGAPVLWHWGAALLTSLLFFASVVAHEFSHAVVARRRGIPINSITLFLFGGVAQMEDEPNTPGDELSMAIAGPLCSVALGIVFLSAAWLFEKAPASAGNALWFAMFLYLGFINVVLAVFNMLPGFPMDGGRVFRALVWKITGNLRQSTLVASVTGQAFGWAFITLGLGPLFAGIIYPQFRGYGNLWLALVGWFLISAARNSYRQMALRETLTQVHVSDLMTHNMETVPVGFSVERLVNEYLLRDGAAVVPVEQDGRVVGMVGVENVRKTPREQWPTMIVSEIMTPLSDETTVHPEDDAWDAANRMAKGNSDRLLVEQQGRIDGVVTQNAIARWLRANLGPGFAPGEA